MQALRRLNFRHLRYFVSVATEGSVSAAAERLHVAPQTVSAQVLALEDAFGRPLFERVGKRLVLNADGEMAMQYAKRIFALGEELSELLSGVRHSGVQRLRLGITQSVPKMLASKVLEPVVQRHGTDLELTCLEGRLNELLAQALEHRIDAVLSDMPAPPEISGALKMRQLARPGISFLAASELALRHPGRFPQRLRAMPFLSWSSESLVSVAVLDWLAQQQAEPHIVGRFDDSALMKAFAQRGLGAIAVPTLVEKDVCRQYALRALGRTEQVVQPVYLMAPKRLRSHALVELLWTALD